MSTLVPELQVPPKYDAVPKGIVEPRAEKTAQWLETLPLANPFETVRELCQMLGHWNRIEVPAEKRIGAIEVIHPLVEDLSPILRREYQEAELPLSTRKHQRADLVQTLWTEMAYAYKLAFMNLILTKKVVNNPGDVLVPSILGAMHALTHRLVESYIVYTTEAPNTWLELHQLYQYARANSINEVVLVTATAYPESQPTIENTYRKALLLALSDPYHLMPGEIVRFLSETSLWMAACTPLALHNGAPKPGKYYIDARIDAPPMLATEHHADRKVEIGVTLDTAPLARLVERRIHGKHTGAGFDHAKQTTLNERLQTEMYQRLQHAWAPRADRQSPRRRSDAHVLLAAGLEACHYYAGEGRLFQPEQDELLLNSSKKGMNNPLEEFEILDDDDMPWLEDVEGDAANQDSRADFKTSQGTDSDDVWDLARHATELAVRFHSKATDRTVQHNATVHVQDASSHGLSLAFPLSDSHLHTRVGDLVAVNTATAATDPNENRWRVGATRWLRIRDNARLELGIEVIAMDALAVATRAISGVGKGGRYFRALLIPKADPREKRTTLITLPAIYDAGTVLVVNSGNELFYARLIHLMEGTKSFARFEFRLLDHAPVSG